MNTTAQDDAAWRRLLAPYKKASWRSALIQVANTLIPFAATWAALVWSVMAGYWLLAVPLVCSPRASTSACSSFSTTAVMARSSPAAVGTRRWATSSAY